MFSKLFGKKQPAPEPPKFIPENRLETLLIQAATDQVARPEFIKALLDFDLFISIDSEGTKYGSYTAQEGDTMRIKGLTIDGKNQIPIFTSERRFREFIKTQESFARIKGQDLFGMLAAGDASAILNPGASYGKFLTHDEIVGLANGTYFQPKQQVIQKATNVLIGIPLEYPTKVIEALRNYFRAHSQVKKAYFAQIHIPESGDPPHLVFSIDADGDYRQIAAGISEVIMSVIGQGQIFDMVQFGQGALDDYFSKQQPFYQK